MRKGYSPDRQCLPVPLLVTAITFISSVLLWQAPCAKEIIALQICMSIYIKTKLTHYRILRFFDFRPNSIFVIAFCRDMRKSGRLAFFDKFRYICIINLLEFTTEYCQSLCRGCGNDIGHQ